MQRLSGLGLFISIFPRLGFYSYVATMRKALQNCESCLDVGCGRESPALLVPFERYVGIDARAPAVEQAKQRHPNREFQLGLAQELVQRFGEHEFDCVVALDLIEHLPKEEGLQFIKDISWIAKKRVLLFTPNGFHPQSSQDDDLQEHLSGWEPNEMRELGFEVVGMLGPKRLRGQYHQTRIKPRALGGVLSWAGHVLYSRRKPEAAAGILCVKDVSLQASFHLRG